MCSLIYSSESFLHVLHLYMHLLSPWIIWKFHFTVHTAALTHNIDAEQTLDNIVICRVFSHEEQMGAKSREAVCNPSSSVLFIRLSYNFNFTVITLRPSSSSDIDIVKPIAALLADAEQGPFRLLIIDSIIALFRVEFSGRGELSERQQKLGQHLSVCVIFTPCCYLASPWWPISHPS